MLKTEFNQARGHNIERQNYLKRLQLYETKPLFFIHNENDIDPRQDFNNGRRTKERVKPRHRHRMRFNNVHSEQRESTSRMDYSYRRTNEEYFPNRYQQQFNPSVPHRMPHPNSMPIGSYNNYRGHDSRRDFNRNDFRRSDTHEIPPYQNVFNNRYNFVGPRSRNQFSRHHPHHPPAYLTKKDQL